MTARTLSIVRADFTHAVLTTKRTPIGYGTQRDCDDYVARNGSQKANPGCFVQELKPFRVRKTYVAMAATITGERGPYVVTDYKGKVLGKDMTMSNANQYAEHINKTKKIGVKVFIPA
jgi:hypothetical protein